MKVNELCHKCGGVLKYKYDPFLLYSHRATCSMCGCEHYFKDSWRTFSDYDIALSDLDKEFPTFIPD